MEKKKKRARQKNVHGISEFRAHTCTVVRARYPDVHVTCTGPTCTGSYVHGSYRARFSRENHRFQNVHVAKCATTCTGAAVHGFPKDVHARARLFVCAVGTCIEAAMHGRNVHRGSYARPKPTGTIMASPFVKKCASVILVLLFATDSQTHRFARCGEL